MQTPFIVFFVIKDYKSVKKILSEGFEILNLDDKEVVTIDYSGVVMVMNKIGHKIEFTSNGFRSTATVVLMMYFMSYTLDNTINQPMLLTKQKDK